MCPDNAPPSFLSSETGEAAPTESVGFPNKDSGLHLKYPLLAPAMPFMALEARKSLLAELSFNH